MNVYISKASKSEPSYVAAYACKGDAGMDICAAEDVILRPGETKTIKTNIKLGIPEGYEIQVRPRSGISFKTPLRVANAPGTIDSGYKDELMVIMTNTSSDHYWDEADNIHRIPSSYVLDVGGNPIDGVARDPAYGNNGTYKILKGQRIAQIVLCKYETIEWNFCDDVKDINSSNIVADRKGGFGHSGIN